MIKRIIFLIAFVPLLGFTQVKYDYVGIWQDSPVVASGWSDTYLFFSDGTFIFHYNQMICDNRNIWYSGNWEVINDSNLSLIIITKAVLIGGTLVPSSGSCASEYEIEGGEIIATECAIPESKSIILSDYIIDTENHSLETMMFDRIRFWRISNDPKNYY